MGFIYEIRGTIQVNVKDRDEANGIFHRVLRGIGVGGQVGDLVKCNISKMVLLGTPTKIDPVEELVEIGKEVWQIIAHDVEQACEQNNERLTRGAVTQIIIDRMYDRLTADQKEVLVNYRSSVQRRLMKERFV